MLHLGMVLSDMPGLTLAASRYGTVRRTVRRVQARHGTVRCVRGSIKRIGMVLADVYRAASNIKRTFGHFP